MLEDEAKVVLEEAKARVVDTLVRRERGSKAYMQGQI
jgi:hypothetical protein